MTGRYVGVEALGILNSKDNARDDIPSSSAVYVYTIERRSTIKIASLIHRVTTLLRQYDVSTLGTFSHCWTLPGSVGAHMSK